MKLLLMLCAAWSAWGAGSVTSTLTSIPGPGGTATFVLTYSWTGDASTGSVPATASPALSANPFVQGYYMTAITLTPGSPSPTGGYAVTVKDANGYDWLAGQAASLSATAPASYVNTAAPPLSGSLTLAVTGNSVASAQGSVVVYFANTRTTSNSGWTDDGTTITAQTGRNVQVGGNVQITATVSAKNIPITVTAPPYNADPTGVADATSAINAAIAAAVSAGGRRVLAPAGTYKITGAGIGLDHIADLGVQLIGDAAGGTVISCQSTPICVDLGGSNNLVLRDLQVSGSSVGVGILVCRYADSNRNGQNLFENVKLTGSYTVAPVYSIASEQNTWIHNSITVAFAGPAFYTSPSNDLGVTSTRGTIQASTNVHHTMVGNRFSNSLDSASASGIQIAKDTEDFNWTSGYISTCGKGIAITGTAATAYSGVINITGSGIENFNGCATVNYFPVYVGNHQRYNLNIRQNNFIQGSNTNPDIYAADSGDVRFSTFDANYHSNGVSFYSLISSKVTVGNGASITTRNSVTGSLLRAATLSITGTDIGNEKVTDTAWLYSGAVTNQAFVTPQLTSPNFLGTATFGTPQPFATWTKYALAKIANGVNGCSNANGCWQVNGALSLSPNASAATSQDVALAAMPASNHITDYRVKTNAACTGTTTALTGLGTSFPGSDTYYRASNYDIQAAVSATNLVSGPPTKTGEDTTAANRWLVASLVTTGANVDQLVAGCAVDFWVLQTVVQ